MKLELSDVISTLSVGQQFKTYNDLCSVLQLKPTTGKSKQLQMQEIERFMSLEKQGHKFIIREIFAVPKEKAADQRSQYKNQIESLLIQGLRTPNKTEKRSKRQQG